MYIPPPSLPTSLPLVFAHGANFYVAYFILLLFYTYGFLFMSLANDVPCSNDVILPNAQTRVHTLQHAEFPQLRIVLVCPTSVSTGFRDNWKKDMSQRGVAAPSVDVNEADLTAEQCVAAVWDAFDRRGAAPGLVYAMIVWRRCGWAGERMARHAESTLHPLY